jgi:hypothetical protein
VGGLCPDRICAYAAGLKFLGQSEIPVTFLNELLLFSFSPHHVIVRSTLAEISKAKAWTPTTAFG